MLKKKIVVINPNSLVEVTHNISHALSNFHDIPWLEIECLTLHAAPPGIQSEEDVSIAALETGKAIKKIESNAKNTVSAYVIACFSDPGLYLARQLTNKPVYGISECGLLTALGMAYRVGVIAILSTSIERHLRAYSMAGIRDRVVGERALELNVSELSRVNITQERMLVVARKLHDVDGAGAIVLGCAGMPQYRSWLESQLGIPVIDPTAAAVAMSLNQLTITASLKGD